MREDNDWFYNSIEKLNNYKGSEKKKTLIYNNKYLTKFPDPVREKNKNISYINMPFQNILEVIEDKMIL